MTESSRVPRVPEAENMDSSRVPRAHGAERTEYPQVPRGAVGILKYLSARE